MGHETLLLLYKTIVITMGSPYAHVSVANAPNLINTESKSAILTPAMVNGLN